MASAVGLDEARGDVLTLKALDFLPVGLEGTTADAGLLDALGPINLMQLIQLTVLSLLALVLGLFVLRPILMSRRPGQAGQDALPGMAGTLSLPMADGMGDFNALTGVIDDFGAVDMSGDGENEGASNDPVDRLRRLIEQRQAESVEILRGWMEQNEEPA